MSPCALDEQEILTHCAGDRLRGIGRHGVADPLALFGVGQPGKLELLFRLDQALQPGELDRRERAVPSAIERPVHRHETIGHDWQTRIGNRLATVVLARGRRDGPGGSSHGITPKWPALA